jgi:hypothetical protein
VCTRATSSRHRLPEANGNAPAADTASTTLHITAGGVDKDVAFVDADTALNDTLDAAYRAKYRRYSADPVDRITSDTARATTIQLVPTEEQGT